jgi:hypothetical protein
MKVNVKYRAFSFAATLILLFGATHVRAQSRGGELEIVDRGGGTVGRFINARALLIGECEYNNGWRRLPGVKEDVASIKRLFEEQGFTVETIEDASSRNLERGITNFLDRYGYEPDARIVLYFAGHGATVDLGGRRMGYIIPVDAPPAKNSGDFLQAAIPMTQFETWAKKYTSRHILFVFDSCFAGSVFRSQTSAPPAINRLIGRPVRQFITSGDADEEVPDESIFRREFEYALRDGAADMNGDGYVSGTELGFYLFDRVSNYMNGRQNPRVGKLNDTNLDKGDFIFTITTGSSRPKVALPQVPERTPAQGSATATNRIEGGTLQVRPAPAEIRFEGETLNTAEERVFTRAVQQALQRHTVFPPAGYEFLVAFTIRPQTENITGTRLLLCDVSLSLNSGGRLLYESASKRITEISRDRAVELAEDYIRDNSEFWTGAAKILNSER